MTKNEGLSGFPPEVVEQHKQNKAQREELKRQYGTLFDKISATLFRNDPMGINFETNADEYEPEVGTILPRLRTCTNEQDVLNVVYEEFTKWFEPASVGPREHYTIVSAEIWAIWNLKEKPTTGSSVP
jgi:hypothetical protein